MENVLPTDQKFVLISFMSPEKIESTNYAKLLQRIEAEEDFEEKCKLYHELFSIKKKYRALKIRGVFSTEEDAKAFASSIRESDPNFDIYCGNVGEWLPFDDDQKAHDIQHPDGQLADLMHSYKESREAALKDLKARTQKAVSSSSSNSNSNGQEEEKTTSV